MKKFKLAFRVDAHPASGTGHFFRCVTLADYLASCCAEIVFVTRFIPENLAQIVHHRGYQLSILETPINSSGNDDLQHSAWLGNVTQEFDADQTNDILKHMGCDWMIVDHYAIDIRWEKRLRACVSNILVIDDLADRIHDCDLLLDQNLFGNAEDRYKGKIPSHAQLLCGPKYALLRDEFRECRDSRARDYLDVKTVLVFFGGSDALDWTKDAVDALVLLGKYFDSIDVVVGAQYSRSQELRQFCESHGFFFHSQISNMAEMLASADLVIGAGGTSIWERCCVGVPSFTIPIALNQLLVVQEAAQAGIIYGPNLSSRLPSEIAMHIKCLASNPNLLMHLSCRGKKLVDGFGKARVARKMGILPVSIRLAGVDDSEMIFAWRNHPSIRSVSRVVTEISRETHNSWYSGVLADPHRTLLIGEIAGKAVGVVRFDSDVERQSSEVSIYLDPNETRKGYGIEILLAAEQWIHLNKQDIRIINAEVLGDNMASHLVFQAAGYTRSSTFYSKKVSQ